MNRSGWNNCPDIIGHQVHHILGEIEHRLKNNLPGVYLHGSLAGVLNSCRVCAYPQEKLICSKEEGAVWALSALAEFSPVIGTALEIYRGQQQNKTNLTEQWQNA